MKKLALLLAFATVACGGPGDSASQTVEQSEVINNSPASIAEARFAESLGINLADFQSNETGLHWRDIVVGEGPVVEAGQTVSAHYTGWLPDGTQFETSRGGTPISFAVGTGRVIEGWDKGLLGMRVGGTRQLLIPGALAYGPRAMGPIPANATLIFTVEVVSAQ